MPIGDAATPAVGLTDVDADRVLYSFRHSAGGNGHTGMDRR